MPNGIDWGKDISTAIDAILTHFEKKQAAKKTQKIISEAEKKGHQVEYTVDPGTGVITPKIKTRQADPYAGMIQEALKSGQFELGGLTKAGPTFKRVKELKIDEQEKLQTIAVLDNRQKIIEKEGGQYDIKLPTLSGAEFEIDLANRASVEIGLSLQFGSLWKDDPDIKAALDRSFIEKPKKRVEVLEERVEQKFKKRKTGETFTDKTTGVTYIRDEQGKWYPTTKK